MVIYKICTGKNADGSGRGQFKAAYCTKIYSENILLSRPKHRCQSRSETDPSKIRKQIVSFFSGEV